MADDMHDAPLRCGLLLPSTAGTADQLDFGLLVDGALRAEESGFDALWLTDHLYHGKPMYEALTTVAVVLARTQRLPVGTAVLQLALRPPALVAKQIATLASLAPGRLEVGIGVGGEYPREWEAAGVPLDERGARTTEAVGYLRRLLAGETLDEAGRFSRFGGVRLLPVPPSPVPLHFAGRRPAALRRAAILGDGWIGAFHTPTGFARDRAAIAALRSEAGLGAKRYSYGMLLPLYLDDHDDGAVERASDAMSTVESRMRLDGRYIVAGTPDTVLCRLTEFIRAGCRNLVLELIPRGTAWEAQLERLVGLLPAVRQAYAALPGTPAQHDAGADDVRA